MAVGLISAEVTYNLIGSSIGHTFTSFSCNIMYENVILISNNQDKLYYNIPSKLRLCGERV